jgi:enoyl-[acyl-carrier-protein] reductase (NADH)
MSFHIPETQFPALAGKVGLVTGIANDQSIAYGCARALRDVGASPCDNLPQTRRRNPMSSRSPARSEPIYSCRWTCARRHR